MLHYEINYYIIFALVPSLSKLFKNRLKSLKFAQVKDEMDDDEDNGCDSV